MSTTTYSPADSRRKMLESFSGRASSWDSDPRRQHLIRDVLNGLRRTIPLKKSWRVLDYGCGTGSLALQLLPLVNEVTAADAAPGMVAETTRRKFALVDRSAADRLTTLHLDLVQEPPLNLQFNLIVASCVLHHVADLDGIFDAFGKMAAPDAWIAIVDWAQPNPQPSALPYPIIHRSSEIYAAGLQRHLSPAQTKCQIVHHFPQDDGNLRPAFLISAGPVKKR